MVKRGSRKSVGMTRPRDGVAEANKALDRIAAIESKLDKRINELDERVKYLECQLDIAMEALGRIGRSVSKFEPIGPLKDDVNWQNIEKVMKEHGFYIGDPPPDKDGGTSHYTWRLGFCD